MDSVETCFQTWFMFGFPVSCNSSQLGMGLRKIRDMTQCQMDLCWCPWVDRIGSSFPRGFEVSFFGCLANIKFFKDTHRSLSEVSHIEPVCWLWEWWQNRITAPTLVFITTRSQLCASMFLQSKLLMWFCWYLFWNMWWPWHLESNCGRTWNPEMWCVEQPWEETCEILRNTHLDTLIQLFREPLWETLSHFIERPWETSWNPVRDLEKPCVKSSQRPWESVRDLERPWETLWETMRDLERPWETLRDLERPWETWVTLKEPGLSFIFCVFMQHSADTIWFPFWFPFYHRNTTRNHATATALCPFIYPWGLQSYLRCRTQGFENLLHKAYIW